ncbi:t-protein [endosymbiont of Euscepes postfasciatus]|uniref:chorismate mutase n=1 Tax=endosymbiont of Euscepes postfasciatus TaxID=650377 RepID=UPI000DC70998|nr:chorismate mutase [endosymbiont of Euscepes postfasciatus]BBA84650.1 t-protein [endosymbiont of Euscepes postfasciatus]
MIKNIENIRKKIDIIDNKILDLIEKRLKKVHKLSILKNKLNIPSYIKEREKDVIYNKIIENKRINISNDLIKDILKRIMYESYSIENKYIKIKKYKLYKILFIGKNKNLFKNLFLKSNYKIYELDINFDKKDEKYIKLTNVIFIQVPISEFKITLNKIVHLIKKKCIIIDLSYNKHLSVKIISNYKMPFLSICITKEYDSNYITKNSIIICYLNDKEKFIWFFNQLKLWGINLIELDYTIYNEYIIKNESLKYFIFITYIYLIKNKNIDLEKIFKYSSPLNKIFMCFILFFIKNNELYLENIINFHNIEKYIKEYIYYMNRLLNDIKNKKYLNIKLCINNILKIEKSNILILEKYNNLLLRSLNIY